MSFRRFASIASALLVAAIAAVASYSHMRHLALQYGQDRVIATLLPVSVDGMLVVATVALGDGRRNRWSAWLAFWVGVVASVIANVLAAQPSAIARCISAWPAVAFLLVVEVITRGGRIRAAVASPPVAIEVASEVASAPGTPVPEPPATAAPLVSPDGDQVKLTPAATKVAKFRARRPAATQSEVATKTGVPARTVQRHWAATTPPAAEPVNGSPVPELITTDF